MSRTTVPNDRLISPEQAAEYLGCTTHTIRNQIARGELTGYKIRGVRAVRVLASEVQALLEPMPTVRGRAPGNPVPPVPNSVRAVVVTPQDAK